MDLDFPAFISFTVTNACNLRCRMCGQWSEEGYVRGGQGHRGRPLDIEEWKQLVDEAAAHGVTSLLVRGGEPFLLPGIVELLEHANARGIFVSIDSNGTRLADFAAELVRLGRLHVTVSVDGREDVHDAVRGVPGCFRQIERGLARLAELDGALPRRVSRSICFTISPWSLPSLGEMPAVARRLGVDSITIVPYCYVPPAAGDTWTREVRELTGAEAFSWRGFQHAGSAVDGAAFAAQHERYRAALDDLFEYPYMALTPDEYRAWFKDASAWVGRPACDNAERLIDIQPNGEANCCVDLPDISLGNVRDASLAEIWNGERARRFRDRRREGPLGACYRCVARHMSTPRDEKGRPVSV